MAVEHHPGSLTGLSDDRLGTAAVSIVVDELQWLPDVAPAVMDRVSRDAVAYPDHFDRRPVAPPPPGTPPFERSAQRTLGRLVVFGIILVVIVSLVFFAATVSATADQAALLPIGQIDGTLDMRRIVHVVTEAA